MPLSTPCHALPHRPSTERFAVLLALAAAMAVAGAAAHAATARAAQPKPSDRAQLAASEPLPAQFEQIGPFCNVVNDPEGITSLGNCFESGYACPLAFERPIGYGMMKVRLSNVGDGDAVVRSWWHVIVRCRTFDVGPYVTHLQPGESKVVSHAQPAFSFNDKVRFYRWTVERGSVRAGYAGAGCAPANSRGLPGRFTSHPRRGECGMNFALSTTWSPRIFLPMSLSLESRR